MLRETVLILVVDILGKKCVFYCERGTLLAVVVVMVVMEDSNGQRK